MYADFESVLIKQHGCTNDGKKSWGEYLQHHVPCGTCFYVISSDERFFRRPVIFLGETAVEEFLGSVMVTENEHHFKKENFYEATSSVKWSDTAHFLKAQSKFIFSFPCTLFYIFLTPKNDPAHFFKVSR